MGAENSKFRENSLRFLRTLSGRRFREQSSKSSSTAISMENINQTKSDRNKNSNSSRQQSSANKPKSESVRYKTKWPYPHVEKDFLPVYNMKNENQKDFTIIHIIASGAYGSVLKGFENKTRRDVAIKVIDKSRVLSEGHGAIQQCKDEVLIQSELPGSPFIVQLVAFWQTRNRLYLVLEYIPNGELFELWKTIRIFSESLARFYLSQVAMALDFLHRNNVVYRDLKMENILLDSNAHIKLIDFGLSKRLNLNDRTTTTCGTLQYTAPEVLKGEPYGHNVDWWSMGILGYALLNGKFPVFGAKNHVEMRTMVANNQYRMPLHLSNEAADMLTSLLQKNPFNRIQNLEDLMKARYFKCCLNYAGSKLDMKHFITKQDVDKIPDTFPLKPIFELSLLDVPKALPNVISDTVDYAEPIWKMSSGKNHTKYAPEENGIRDLNPPELMISKKKPEKRVIDSTTDIDLSSHIRKDPVPNRHNWPPNPPVPVRSSNNNNIINNKNNNNNNSIINNLSDHLNSQSSNFRFHLTASGKEAQHYSQYSVNKDANITLSELREPYPRARNI